MLIKNHLQSERLYLRNLRPITLTDDYVVWVKDPDVNQYLEVRHQNLTMRMIKRFIKQCNKSSHTLMLGIFLNNGNHIGNIKLGPVSEKYRRAYIGILIGDKSTWGHGYGTEAINLLTHYGLNDLGLNSIWAGSYSVNEASLRLFKKCGYKEAAVIPSYWLDGSQYCDNILMVKY